MTTQYYGQPSGGTPAASFIDYCELTLAADQTISGATTTKVTLDTVITDGNGLADTVNHVIKIKNAGKYIVGGTAQLAGGSNVGLCALWLGLNALATHRISQMTIADASGVLGGSRIFTLAVNDTIELDAYITTGTTPKVKVFENLPWLYVERVA